MRPVRRKKCQQDLLGKSGATFDRRIVGADGAFLKTLDATAGRCFFVVMGEA